MWFYHNFSQISIQKSNRKKESPLLEFKHLWWILSPIDQSFSVSCLQVMLDPLATLGILVFLNNLYSTLELSKCCHISLRYGISLLLNMQMLACRPSLPWSWLLDWCTTGLRVCDGDMLPTVMPPSRAAGWCGDGLWPSVHCLITSGWNLDLSGWLGTLYSRSSLLMSTPKSLFIWNWLPSVAANISQH